MTSKTIYTPFTYCITFLPTGQRYYGVRYSIKEVAHPDQLWTTYFTSSKIIKDLIKEYGVDSFFTQIRKTFTDGDTANASETKFLTKIDAANSQDWLNDHNGSSKFHTTIESVNKTIETKKRNGTMNTQKPDSRQKAVETRKRNGTMDVNTPESRQKAVETRKRNGTMDTNTPESIQKCKDTRLRNGTLHPSTIAFLSIIISKKTYAKNTISRFFPEFKQYY